MCLKCAIAPTEWTSINVTLASFKLSISQFNELNWLFDDSLCAALIFLLSAMKRESGSPKKVSFEYKLAFIPACLPSCFLRKHYSRLNPPNHVNMRKKMTSWWFLLPFLTLNVDSKVVIGRLRTGDSWAFLTRFCFLSMKGKFKVRTNVKYPFWQNSFPVWSVLRPKVWLSEHRLVLWHAGSMGKSLRWRRGWLDWPAHMSRKGVSFASERNRWRQLSVSQ